MVLPRGSSAHLTDRTGDADEEAAAAASAGDPAGLGDGSGCVSAGEVEPRLELLWEWTCEQTQGFTVTCLAWCKARAIYPHCLTLSAALQFHKAWKSNEQTLSHT